MEMALTDKLKRLDRTLLELITGIFVFGLACQSAALPFSINQVKFAAGLWMGILIAFFSAIHMWRSLNKAFMCDEKSAARLLAGGYLIRYLITGVFLAVLLFTNAGYVLAGFLGVMGIKAGAYLQPVTHRFYNWIFHEKDPVPRPVSEEDGEPAKSMEE